MSIEVDQLCEDLESGRPNARKAISEAYNFVDCPAGKDADGRSWARFLDGLIGDKELLQTKLEGDIPSMLEEIAAAEAQIGSYLAV